MKNRTLLLAAALLFAISPILAGNTAKTDPQSNQIVSPAQCNVSYDMVYSYLLQHGYVATAFTDVEGTCNVKAKTTTGKVVIVYVEDSVIIGYEDESF